jgi:hypothetical protein
MIFFFHIYLKIHWPIPSLYIIWSLCRPFKRKEVVVCSWRTCNVPKHWSIILSSSFPSYQNIGARDACNTTKNKSNELYPQKGSAKSNLIPPLILFCPIWVFKWIVNSIIIYYSYSQAEILTWIREVVLLIQAYKEI